MNLEITPAVLAAFSDKDSKLERYRALYQSLDFLTAYSRHTDLRMADDPKGAIGRSDEWESHGLLQRDFLIAEGLRPPHRLLDVGCGPGRAARRLVPYLDKGRYIGIDISLACLAHAVKLSVSEGWSEKDPVFLHNAALDLASVTVDMIWAHSVFTHLPPQQVDLMIQNAAKILAPGGHFLFTYKRADKPRRSGLKQFQYPIEFFMACASGAGLTCEPRPMIWPAHQRTACLTA